MTAPSPLQPLRPSEPGAIETPRVPRSSGSRMRAQAASEPRVSLHSIDLEVVDDSALHDRVTLPRPIGEEPLDAVIDALRTLTCSGPVEAATVCLAACVRAIPVRAALVHLLDARTGDLVVVYAHGDAARRLLLHHTAVGDATFVDAIAKRAPRVFNYGGPEGRAPLARHATFGNVWSVLVAPVMEDDRVLGLVELVDPLDGSAFDDDAVSALRYATSHLGEILGAYDGAIGNVISADGPDLI